MAVAVVVAVVAPLWRGHFQKEELVEPFDYQQNFGKAPAVP